MSRLTAAAPHRAFSVIAPTRLPGRPSFRPLSRRQLISAALQLSILLRQRQQPAIFAIFAAAIATLTFH
jgi:hypothetical protein